MAESGDFHELADSSVTVAGWAPIALLEEIKVHGRVWADLAAQYGVANPNPPWKTSLEGMCEALAAGGCSSSTAVEKGWLDGRTPRSALMGTPPLPQLERRWEEDELSASLYKDVPFPERQLLALAHSLIKRGLIAEDALARKLAEVKKRLTAE